MRPQPLSLPFELGGIVYDVFREEHRDAGIANLVQEFALRETMNRAVGLTAEEFWPFAEAVCDNAVKDGLSVVAVELNTGAFIAPLFSWEFSNTFLDELDIPRLRPIFSLLGQLAATFERANPESLAQRILYINLMAIPDQHRGRGVGQGLWLAGLVQGWNQGCTLAVAAPTDGPDGPSSRHCLHKMRFTKLCEIAYSDFEHEGERVFAGKTAFDTVFFCNEAPRLRGGPLGARRRPGPARAHARRGRGAPGPRSSAPASDLSPGASRPGAPHFAPSTSPCAAAGAFLLVSTTPSTSAPSNAA